MAPVEPVDQLAAHGLHVLFRVQRTTAQRTGWGENGKIGSLEGRVAVFASQIKAGGKDRDRIIETAAEEPAVILIRRNVRSGRAERRNKTQS